MIWLPVDEPNNIKTGDLVKDALAIGRVTGRAKLRMGHQRPEVLTMMILSGHEKGHNSFMFPEDAEYVCPNEPIYRD